MQRCKATTLIAGQQIEEDNALANLGEGAVQESTGDASAAMKEDSLETLLPIDEHEEIVSEGGKTIIRRGIFLLPNPIDARRNVFWFLRHHRRHGRRL